MFTPPFLVLSFVIASLIGLVFFLLLGHGWVQLLVYWLVALAGFFIGQLIAMALSFSLMPIGSVSVVEGIITCLIALFLVRAVWKRNPAPPA